MTVTEKDGNDITNDSTMLQRMDNHESEQRTLVQKIFGTPFPSPRVIEIADQQALREETINELHPPCVQVVSSQQQSSTEKDIPVEENCSIGSAIIDTENVRVAVND